MDEKGWICSKSESIRCPLPRTFSSGFFLPYELGTPIISRFFYCECFPSERETGMLLPNKQRQRRTSHAPKDVLPLRIWTCCPYAYANEIHYTNALLLLEWGNRAASFVVCYEGTWLIRNSARNPRSPHDGLPGFRCGRNLGCYVTKFAPHKALQLIA